MASARDDDEAHASEDDDERVSFRGSDFDDDFEGNDDGDGYGSDLMGDRDDRARLLGMNELEREEILLERAEARKKIESRKAIVAAAKSRELERARRERGISSAKKGELDALERVASAKKRKERAKRVFGDDSEGEEVDLEEEVEESESEGERRGGRRKSRGAIVDEEYVEYDDADEYNAPATRAQIDSITLKRSQLERWVNEPYFESAISRCMVRVGIGLNKLQENVYRLVEVVGVADGKYKQYSLKQYEYLPGKKTQKWLILRWGQSEKTFRLSEVSNSDVTNDEWAAWVSHLVSSGSRKITQRDVKSCAENLKEAANYRYTEDEVTKILAQKREKLGSRHNLLFEKEQVKQKIAQAEAAGDVEAIAELEQKKIELQRSITERLNPKGTMEALANINKRNEIMNSEKLAKRASEQIARLKRGVTNASEGDAFSRRPTRLTNYWDMGDKKADGEEAKAPAAPAATSNAAPADEDDNIFLTAGVDAQQSEKELADVLQQRHKESASSLFLDLSRVTAPSPALALKQKSTESFLNRGAALLKSSYDAQRAENLGTRPQGKVFSLAEYLAMSNGY